MQPRPTFVARRTLTVRFATKVAAGALLVLLGACASDAPGVEAPRPGTALDVGRDVLRKATIPPGQEVIRIVPALRSLDGPIEITKLRAVPKSGIPDIAQIVQVSVVPGNSGFDSSRYVTYPPVKRTGGKCIRARVRPARGLTMDTHDGWSVLVWMRALAPGRAELSGFKVTYEMGGTLYAQELDIDPTDGALTVDSDVSPIQPSPEERACAHRTRVLPGAVTY